MAYESLCRRLDCDAEVGLGRKDFYNFFEKAPDVLWETVCKASDPLAQMLRRGPETLPQTYLVRPLAKFLFDEDNMFANLYVEANAHMYYGAQELVSADTVQAYFGTQRLELHICAPSSFGASDLYLWKLIVAPLSNAIIPEDSTLEIQTTTGRFGAKKIHVKLMKAKERKKWYKIGQAVTGETHGSGCSG